MYYVIGEVVHQTKYNIAPPSDESPWRYLTGEEPAGSGVSPPLRAGVPLKSTSKREVDKIVV